MLPSPFTIGAVEQRLLNVQLSKSDFVPLDIKGNVMNEALQTIIQTRKDYKNLNGYFPKIDLAGYEYRTNKTLKKKSILSAITTGILDIVSAGNYSLIKELI
jgi:hypothetical protein